MKPILSTILSVASTKLNDDEKRLLEKSNPVGVALFSRNLKTQKQTTKLIKSIKETIGRDNVLIALDQEGGRVNRLKSAGFNDYASQSILGKIGKSQIVRSHAKLISADMRSIGANFNFAPVLDIDYPETTFALKSRCFGSKIKKIAHYGRLLWQTYAQYGICPCIKHMPGHGRAQADPHLGLPIVQNSLEELAQDFYPFIQNKDCPAAMTAHILLSCIDRKTPLTLSKKGISEIIRGIIDYQGFLISDAIEMHALKGNLIQRISQAHKAGCDATCYCLGHYDALEAICTQPIFLSDSSLERLEKIFSVFNKHKNQRKLDLEKKKYYSLTNLYAQEKVNYDATEVLFKLEKGES